MKNPKDTFLRGRVRSLKFAIKGVWILLKSEPRIQVQTIIVILMTILGFVMELSSTEWLFQVLAFALVLVSESLNTAIEKICDFVNPEYDERIGIIKDISAGAVTFAAFFAIVIALILYLPKFISF